MTFKSLKDPVCFLFGCLLFPAAFTKNVLAELRSLVTSVNKIWSSADGVLNLHPQRKESAPVTDGTVFHGRPTHVETRRKEWDVVETSHPVRTLGFGWQSRKRRSSGEDCAAFVQYYFILFSVCLVPRYLLVWQESDQGFLQSFWSKSLWRLKPQGW